MARAPRAPKKIDHNPKAELGDNSQEEAERVQLISFISKANNAVGKVAEAKAPYDAAKKNLNQVFALAKAANPDFTRKHLERLMEEMDDPARENPIKLAREARHRRWLGIIRPEDEQGRLALAPAEVQDEAHWKAEGFKAGLRQMERKPPPECPERFVQAWCAEYDRGLKEVLTANAPKPMPAVGAQAAADFKADNPEVDVDAAAAKLRADPAFMARGAEAEEGDKMAGAEEPFEATEEELQAQGGRRAIQERRAAGEGEPEPVV